MLPKTVTKKELSTLLDMSNKRITELEKEKIITKNSAGSYDLSNVTDFVLAKAKVLASVAVNGATPER